MGTFITKEVTKALIKAAKAKLKKAVRNKPLNSTQQRNSKNAMETFDDLMEDRGTNIRGATKPSAVIGNKRMGRAIDRIATGKTQTQTDAINALLQGAGVGFAVGVDAVSRKNTNTTKNKTKKVQTKTPPKPKPNPKKVPLPKPNPRIQRANRSMIVTPRKK